MFLSSLIDCRAQNLLFGMIGVKINAYVFT